jgi:hypothetical protein
MPNSFDSIYGSGQVVPSSVSGSPSDLEEQASAYLPAALGTVRIQVVLFEANRCPFVKRTRQVHEFKFTKSTIQFINATNIKNIDIIQEGTGMGVSLARADSGRFPTCYADGYDILAESEDLPASDLGSQSVISEFPSQVNMPPDGQDYLTGVVGKYRVGGFNEIAAGLRKYNDSQFMHQLFVAAPGIFTDIYFPELAGDLLRSQGSDRANNNARSPLEDIMPVSRTRNISERGKRAAVVPGTPDPDSFAATGAGAAVAYVALDNSFVGNLFDRLGRDIYGADVFKPKRTAQRLGSEPRVGVVKSFENLNPGLHATYEKMTSIMPGLDFSIRFQNTTGQFPKADLSLHEDDGNNTVSYRPVFLMRDPYVFLDPFCVVGQEDERSQRFRRRRILRDNPFTSRELFDPQSFSEDVSVVAAEVWPNFGVSPWRVKPPDQGTSDRATFVIDTDAEQYDLSDQPYIIIEIDGGEENRFFIVISHDNDVRVFEVTGDPEFVPALVGSGGQVVNVLRGGTAHSRLLGSMKMKGSSVLNARAFEVSVQHFFGKLQISIDGNEPLIVERHRWNAMISALASVQPLTESNLQQLAAENPESDSQYNNPIKLCGFVRVHMGHYRGAFNFSPIQYVASEVLSTAMPVTALEVGNDYSAISVLLRSKGARGDAGRPSYMAAPSNFVGYTGEGPAYWFQSCNSLSEFIGGTDVIVNSKQFSESIRRLIPGDPYGCIGKGVRDLSSIRVTNASKIQASAKIESNPNNDFAKNVAPTIRLMAGSAYLSGGTKEWELERCLRPICSGFTVFIEESADDRWSATPVDITNHVMSFEDTWTRQERSQIAHSASMTLYLSKGEARGNIESITPATGSGSSSQYVVNLGNRGGSVSRLGTNTNFSPTDHSDYLASLQDKYFYVTVYAWRDGAGKFNGTMYPNIGSGDLAKSRAALFTGICNDVSFRTESNKIIMTCQLRDYTMILEHMRWLNAPFYDAVRDYNVVLDVISQAGFKLGTAVGGGGVASGSPEVFIPGRLIYELAKVKPQKDYQVIQFGDEQIIWNDIVLPGQYNTLNEAIFKPAVNENYLSILQRIAKLSGKVLFFDANGVMHFDIPIDEAEHSQMDRGTQSAKMFPAIRPVDYFSWTVNDKRLIPGNSEGRINEESSVTTNFVNILSEEPNDILTGFGSSNDTSAENLKWWNVVSDTSYTFKRLTSEVFNEIRIISSTPNMSKLYAAHLNRNSVVDPASPSFIGYKKMYYQQEGVFGSKDTVIKAVSMYTTMFNAPIEVTFTVPGRSGLRPMQMIEFNGFGMAGPVRLLVKEVKNSLNADNNLWQTTISGQYFIPGEKVSVKSSVLALDPRSGTVNPA